MKTYLISYDLVQNAPLQEYENLINAIKAYQIWAKPLESVWLIKTEQTASEIMNYLLKFVTTKDRILVVRVTPDWMSYGLPLQVTDWMKTGL